MKMELQEGRGSKYAQLRLLATRIVGPLLKDSGPDKAALAESRRLVLASQKITAVATADQQQAAADLAGDVKAYVKQVQADRKELTKPLDDAKKLVMDYERQVTAPALVEVERVERLIAGFLVLEDERVRREEEARQREVERLQKEADDLARKADKALERAATPAGLERAGEKLMAATDAAQAVQEAIRAPLPEAQRAAGTQARDVVEYRVVDVKALYAARPELCVLEPKASAIRAVCFPAGKQFSASKPDTDSVPGLALWWEKKANIRTTR